MDTEPNKGGRPTSYDPAYCEQLIAHLGEGFSFEAFGGAVGVSKQTLYNWLEAHPEFLDAKKVGEPATQLVWEKRLAKLATSGDGNATAIIFGLKNRASDSWRDVTRTETTGVDGGAIKHETTVTIDASGLSDDQLAALASIPVHEG